MHIDRKLKARWESRLARYGLSEADIRRSGTQEAGKNASGGAVAFDPEWQPHNMWKNPAQRRGYSMHDFKTFGLVPIRHAPRQVPAWAASDGHVRALLEAKYPRIHQPGTRDRRDGARMALLVYFAYRLLFSDETIAGELGIQRATVGFQLWRVKALGDKLFSGAWRIRGRNRSGHPMFERAA